MTHRTSRVDILYDLFQQSETVTYKQAAEALGLNGARELPAIRNAMAGVRRRLLDKDGRALRAIPSVGYRVAAPNEHVTLYRERKGRAKNQLETGREILSGTDLSALSPEARDAVLAETSTASRIIDFIVASDRRQREQEERIEEIKGQVDRSAEETEAIKERLARLETG